MFGFLVHDSDVLLYFLYQGGRRRDAYVSCPGYFSGERLPPSGGDVEALLGMALSGTTERQLRRLLHALRTSGRRPRSQASFPAGLPRWRRYLAGAVVWLYTRAAGPPAEALLAELAACLGIPEVQVLSSFRDVHEDATAEGEAV